MSSRVLVSIRVPCTPEEAFLIFTTEIGMWWADSGLFRFTPRSPGQLAFEPPDATGAGGRLVERLDNGKVFEIGPVRTWQPGERLVVGWRHASFGPDHATEVEVRFEPVGEETRVSVEHRGFDRVPADSAARHGFPDQALLMRLGQWWRDLLDGLRAIA
jgi:hypothetical protein